MRFLFLAIIGLSFLSCKQNPETSPTNNLVTAINKDAKPITLNLAEANKLITLPLFCVGTEYPNKLSQTLSGHEDLRAPTILHPAFYGCFDWHSSVHGHWSMVYLLKTFPEMEKRDSILKVLRGNLTEQNILKEVNYFKRKHEGTFERTYGWAWLLKLAEELHTWDDPTARILEHNLQPLTDVIVNKYIEFLPRLHYPIRVGTHSNTAFGLSFAYDFALTTKNDTLQKAIAKRAKAFYLKDKGCPLLWEPSGYDFLSPCFEEIDLMRKVLSNQEFAPWLKQFMPGIDRKDFTLKPGIVSDRSDGHLVHLDGLNYSRAWCLYGIANSNIEFEHLRLLANQHLNYSYPNLIGDDYEGGHWLASFALMAMKSQTNF